jgi:hypothetical protein
MARIARATAIILLVIATSGIAGCIHTWTETYAEFPPSIYDGSHAPRQGDPSDG